MIILIVQSPGDREICLYIMSGQPTIKSAGKYNRNISIHNRVKLIRGGKEYFDCLAEMIQQAKQTIHIQVYIFANDETGRRITGYLKDAVKRGVKVFIVVDGYASKSLAGRFVSGMREAGIFFRFFSPLLKSKHFYFGRRLHHKVIVADAQFALAGGINIADRYNDMPEQPAWLDFALYTEGEAAHELHAFCHRTWHGHLPDKVYNKALSPGDLVNIKDECRVSINRNDWVRRRNEISSAYVNMLLRAKSHVTILSSYFLPGRVIRKHIAAAARRGVHIRVITAGTSDIWLAKHAERYMYDWLLRLGVEIYEYKGEVLHGKIAVCDDEWLTIGSYNINNLSAYASIELNMSVYNKNFAVSVSGVLDKIAQNECIPVTKRHQAKTTNWLKRLVRWVSYSCIHAGLYLSTFYYRHNLPADKTQVAG